MVGGYGWREGSDGEGMDGGRVMMGRAWVDGGL